MPLRSTSSVRSSAVSSREAVDFGRPHSSASEAKLTGSSARTTVATSRAARSTACVPLAAGLLMLDLLRSGVP